jgi:protein associated with RNAse G/E
MTPVRPDDLIDVRALRADGVAYRWWRDVVEAIDDEKLVAFSPLGKEVHGLAGNWIGKYIGRIFYWFERPYNLAEIYYPDGRLLELYVNIASPAILVGHQLTFTDHELDVVLKPGQEPIVVDEDEFAAAAITYGYTPEFQAACYHAVAEALDLVVAWKPLR